MDAEHWSIGIYLDAGSFAELHHNRRKRLPQGCTWSAIANAHHIVPQHGVFALRFAEKGLQYIARAEQT